MSKAVTIGKIESASEWLFCKELQVFIKPKVMDADINTLYKYLGEKYPYGDSDVFLSLNDVFPVNISLFTSSSCNMRCGYCYYSSGSNNDIDLSKEDLDTLVGYLIKNAQIRRFTGKDSNIQVTLTGGGEPTYNWENFTYFVEGLRRKAVENDLSVQYHLITNGILTDKQINYVCDNIDSIQISYDGVSEIQNENRKLRNGGESAVYVEKTMKELSKKGKEFYVRSTINPGNYCNILNMVKNIFGKYSSAVAYHIEPVQYTGRGVQAKRDSDKDNEILIAQYKAAVKLVRNQYSNRVIYCSFFDHKNIRVACSSITGNTPIIDNRGYLFPCSDRLNPDTQSIGRLANGKINIERESFYKKEYEKMLTTECGSCIYFSLCGGGCYSSFKRDENGHLLPEGKSKCDLIKTYWGEAFSSLIKSGEFMDLRLKEKNNIDDWIIYEIEKTDNEDEIIEEIP